MKNATDTEQDNKAHKRHYWPALVFPLYALVFEFLT